MNSKPSSVPFVQEVRIEAQGQLGSNNKDRCEINTPILYSKGEERINRILFERKCKVSDVIFS